MSLKPIIKDRGLVRGATTVALAVGLAACGGPDTNGADRYDAYDPAYGGFEELQGGLTPLPDGSCKASTGYASGDVINLDLVIPANQVAILAKRPLDGAIAVNGVACTSDGTASGVVALATKVKKITITGDATSEAIVDYSNGTFALGTNSGVGISVGAMAEFKIRGSKAVDTITLGDKAGSPTPAGNISINTDSYADIDVAANSVITISVGAAADVISGQGGKGTGTGAFDPGTGSLTIYGGEDGDSITGSKGNDTIYGNEGDDTFVETAAAANSGADTYAGGAGNDTLTYAARSAGVYVVADGSTNSGLGVDGDADGRFDSSSENDKVGSDIETIVGSTAADYLAAATSVLGAAGTTLDGNAGDDVLVGGAGKDTFVGGAGTDTVDYTGSTAVTVTIDGTANDGIATEGDNVKIDVENVIGTAGDDTITGSASDNVIDGAGGNDTLNGGAGNDTFLQGAAADGGDIISGGAGTDVVDYSERTADLTVTMDGLAADDGLTGENDNIKGDIENLIGGDGDDDITGNDLDNVIEGGDGADDLTGGNGDDTLFGGAGDDNLFGNAGNDTLDGGVEADGTTEGTDVLACGAGSADIGVHGDNSVALDCEL